MTSSAIAVQPEIDGVFRRELFNGSRVLADMRGRAVAKGSSANPVPAPIYSLHTSEVECIGKGKVQKLYEFGVKMSITTTLKPAPSKQFVLCAKALPGKPYDGHTLAIIIPATEAITGVEIKSILADKVYRGDDRPSSP